jgi:hypothetical protein
MMERDDWGKMLFCAFGLAEGGGLISGATYSTPNTIALLTFLLAIVPFLIGYLVARFGLVYGAVLGLAPGFFALSALPTAFFGFSQFVGGLMLFIACVLFAGLSGFAGQRLALLRNAA